MGVIRVQCDKCGKDLLPEFVEWLNDELGTRLTILDIPVLAMKIVSDPNCEISAEEGVLLRDLGLFLLTLLVPSEKLCDDCQPEGSDPDRPGRLH
jgi:hypothetical protein